MLYSQCFYKYTKSSVCHTDVASNLPELGALREAGLFM